MARYFTAVNGMKVKRLVVDPDCYQLTRGAVYVVQGSHKTSVLNRVDFWVNDDLGRRFYTSSNIDLWMPVYDSTPDKEYEGLYE